MKLKRILILFLILTITLSIITSVSGEDTSNLNLTSDVLDDNINEECCENNTDSAKTVVVNPDPENPNQVQKPTVQPAIDSANPGDTIILNGTFVHCHFTINKNLTILAAPGTSVGVCPHHNHPENSTLHGIFYLTSEASGTTINGFSFTNDYYKVAYDVYSPFGIFAEGASDIRLVNLTFDWVGVKSDSSSYDPNDFKFNPIILNNTHNVVISDTFFTNTNVSVTVKNSTDVYILNNDKPVVLNSKISADNLNLKVGESGNINITLKDENNNTIAKRTVLVIIDGVVKNVTTDENGSAKLAVKYSSASTRYVTVSFTGDDDFKSSITTAKITVVKKAAALTVAKKTFKVKAVKKITITLKSGKTPLKGKKITVKVNGKTYSAKTNAKGAATVKVKLTKKGTFTYTAKFAGDSAYKQVSKKGKIVVKK